MLILKCVHGTGRKGMKTRGSSSVDSQARVRIDFRETQASKTYQMRSTMERRDPRDGTFPRVNVSLKTVLLLWGGMNNLIINQEIIQPI